MTAIEFAMHFRRTSRSSPGMYSCTATVSHEPEDELTTKIVSAATNAVVNKQIRANTGQKIEMHWLRTRHGASPHDDKIQT